MFGAAPSYLLSLFILLSTFEQTNQFFFKVEMTPPPYPAQQGNFPAQPGDPQYPAPQPFTGQPMGYPPGYLGAQQSTTTVVTQQVRVFNLNKYSLNK